MKRKIDATGRLVIPKTLREELGIETGCDLDLSADKEKGLLILKKERAVCLSCGAEDELFPLANGKFLCKNCLAEIK